MDCSLYKVQEVLLEWGRGGMGFLDDCGLGFWPQAVCLWLDAYAGHCMFSGFVLNLAACYHCIAASRIIIAGKIL